MTNYTKTTDFAAKDSLPSGNAAKIVKGSEIDTEFNNIATASATKANANNAVLTGTTTAQTLDISGNVDVDGTLETDALSLNGVTVTSTAAELNYVDGVTSAIQTQLDAKAALSGANFTGSIDVTGSVVSDGLTVDGVSKLKAGSTSTPANTAAFISNASAKIVVNHGNEYGAYVGYANSSNDAIGIQSTTSGGTTAPLSLNPYGGNVGIGSSAPSHKLEIESSSDADLLQVQSTAGSNDTALRLGIDGDVATINATGGSTGILALKTYGTERMRVDASGNVGIGTSSPGNFQLNINGSGDGGRQLKVEGPSNNGLMRFSNSTSQDYSIGINNTSFIVYDDTANSYRMVVDSSGNVGIGTTSAYGTNVLNVNGGVAIDGRNASTPGLCEKGDTDTGIFWPAANSLAVTTGAAERMRIDSSGNVGIGTTSMSHPLVIQNATPIIQLIDSNASTRVANIGGENGNVTIDIDPNQAEGTSFFSVDIDNTERMRIDASGNVGIGQSTIIDSASGRKALTIGGSTSSIITFGNAGTRWGGIYAASGDYSIFSDSQMRFEAGGSERMRLDASGNLLVGKTSTGSSVVGQELRANGYNVFTRDGDAPLELYRKTSDGSLLNFTKDGSIVGSIGTSGGDLTIGTGDTGLRFDDGTDQIYPVNGTSTRDGAIDLGWSGGRFQDIYATNGTIQTSDRNEKQDIEALSDAEQRVAVAAKGLLRKFRWKSSVAENGDDARIHFGIIAQDLQDAFTAEGLDAGRYAMFINSTWTDEDTGEERSRMGVRYSELLAFIIAAI